MVPYLNGLHLTIGSWRPHQDAEGWRLIHEPHLEDKVKTDEKDAPEFVEAVTRFTCDLEGH